MSGLIKYMLYLGMSILVSAGVFVAASRPTPITIALLVFDVTNWIWVYRITKVEE